MVNKDEIASLIQKYKDGDKESFDIMYQKLWNLFYFQACKRLENKEDAMDVVQETMMIIHKNIHEIRNESSGLAWMTSVLYNRCFKENKSYKKMKFVNFDDLDENIPNDNEEFLPEDILHNKETWQEISAIVAELPQEQRDAVLMYYTEMLDTNEIAKVMGISQNAVRLRLSRARATIREKIEKLQKKGVVLYSLTTTPILTKILLDEMEKTCTPEIGEQIFTALQTSLAAGGLVTIGTTAMGVASTGTATGVSTATSGLVIKISATILTISVVGGGIAFTISHNTPPAQVTPPVAVVSSPTPTPTVTPSPSPSALVVTIPEPSPTPAPTPTPVIQTVESIDDMVGTEDADIIRSWVVPTLENHHEDFVALTDKHGMVMDSGFVDVDNQNNVYSLYTMEMSGKRLLLCEFYSAAEGVWSAVYTLEDLGEPLPNIEDMPDWFLDTQSQLLMGE